MNELTTMQIETKTIKRLEALKIHERQPIREVIENLLILNEKRLLEAKRQALKKERLKNV